MPALNAYSQRFAEFLFASFPEWKAFAVEALPEVFLYAAKGSLIVRVPCPAPSLWPPTHNWLLIDTADDEIIISWDAFHAHFDSFSGIPEHLGFTDAITFIKELIEEKLCIAVAMDGDEWRGAMVIHPGDKPKFDHGGKPYTRSWRGTYDVPL